MPDAQRAEIDAIIGRALLTAEALTDELRTELVDDLMTSGENVLLILDRYVSLQTQMVAEAELAAWVAGHAAVARKLSGVILELIETTGPPGGGVSFFAPAGEAEPILRFPLIERATEDLIERGIVTRPVYDQMEKEFRDKAFTVAYLDAEETIADIRDVLAERVREGPSLEAFREQVEEKIGVGRLGPAHLETVYRTNIQTAYTNGHDRLADNPVVSDVFPYRAYFPIRDDRTRPEHLALETLGLNGTNVYRADDDFWKVFRIPWGYN